MGREVKRVPMDLDYEIDKVWPGFLMPAELQLPRCPDCAGSGYTAASHYVQALCRLLVMLGDDLAAQERGRPLHPYLAELPVYADRQRPSADIKDLIRGLDPTADPDLLFGYSGSIAYHVKDKLVTAAGLDPETWGICARCSGNGEVGTPEQKAAYEAWEETPVPEGEGWQLWSTTTEGHPVTPVFATGEELAVYMSTHPVGFANSTIPLDVARSWVHDSGWSPSMMFSPATGLVDGITATAGAA